MSTHLRRSVVALTLGGAVAIALASCDGLQDLQLQQACVINSDCTPPLVCAFELCHQQCETTADCPTPEICVRGGGGESAADGGTGGVGVGLYNVCEALMCTSTTDCPSGQVCAPDGQCRDQCSSGAVCVDSASCALCVSGQVCVEDVCVDSNDAGKPAWHVDASVAASVGAGCRLNSDCGDAGLVCRSGVCGVECNIDFDCVAPEGPGGVCRSHVCTLATGVDAAHDVTVHDAGRDGGGGHDGGHDAARDSGHPRDASRDAPRDTSSSHDAGHDVGHVGHDAGLDAALDGGSGLGKACNLPSDCPSPLVCGVHGTCGYQCNAPEDCPGGGLGYCCVAHVCLASDSCAPGSDGGHDTGVTHDAAPPDASCTSCISASTCQDGDWCNGAEICNDLHCCAPSPTGGPCDSHSACIVDTCDSMTQTCTHTNVAGMDVDGDGHLAYACDGGDDCDDMDPTVYTGHPEVYDGKDNDCNGFVDDWVSEPKGTTLAFPNLSCSGATGCYGTSVTLGGPAGVADGGAWGYVQFNSTQAGGGTWQYSAQQYSLAWSPIGQELVQVPDGGIGGGLQYPLAFFGSASGPTTEAFLVEREDVQDLRLAILDDQLRYLTETQLYTNANDAETYPGASLTWTGSNYLVGWAVTDSGTVGQFALVGPDGTLLGVQSVPTYLGAVRGSSTVGVASNGSSLAVGYTALGSEGYSGGVFVTIVSVDGEQGQTVQLDTGVELNGFDILLAVAGAPGGFVALWAQDSNTNATYIPVLHGVVGKLFQVAADADGRSFTNAQGAFDGVGSAFLIGNGSDGSWFGYLNGEQLDAAGNPKNPFELTQISTGTGAPVSLAGNTGGRLAVGYGTQSNLGISSVQAGYCSLAGSACATGTNCCSQVCVPADAGGPMAYSTCQ
jgi:hypothetical protein